jgi:AraC family transcriptional regulator
MEYRIENLMGKKLIGQRLQMSFADNQTFRLWNGFMPRRKEISNALNTDLISMQVYDEAFDFMKVDINRPFEKWAAVEVSNFENIPSGMESFIMPGGLYMVFLYKGKTSDAESFFQYIFSTWLPKSEYLLDNRPHFEILGKKYKNNSPDSEEEVWIPVKQKNKI